jgi:hypothetical protein
MAGETKRPLAGFKLLFKGNFQPCKEARYEYTVCLAVVIPIFGVQAD